MNMLGMGLQLRALARGFPHGFLGQGELFG